MCTKVFLNYLSAIVVFLKVVFKDEIIKFSKHYDTFAIKEKKKDKNKKGGTDGTDGEGVEREEEFFFNFFFSSFLSQIYGNRTIDFLRSRRQS